MRSSNSITTTSGADPWLVPWAIKRSVCWTVGMVGIGLVSRCFEANRSTLVFSACMWSYLVVWEGVMDYRVYAPSYRLEAEKRALESLLREAHQSTSL